MNDEVLPPYPPEAERREAQRMRATTVATVQGKYEIKDGVLHSAPEGWSILRRQYFPMASPSIVGEFSRLEIGDEAELVKFASRWGLLGYDFIGLVSARSTHGPIGGDPVAWIWSHLAGIQLVFRLFRELRRDAVEALSRIVDELSRQNLMEMLGLLSLDLLVREGEFAEAQALLTQHHRSPSELDADPPLGIPVVSGHVGLDNKVRGKEFAVTDPPPSVPVLSGQGRTIEFNPYPVWRGDVPSLAWRIVRGIVNPNLPGVHSEISNQIGRNPDAPRVVQSWDSVMSVIYRHLFEIVVGGSVQECRECGTPFVQTDGRQRFCPPPSWTRESACAMRHHKREQRRRSR